MGSSACGDDDDETVRWHIERAMDEDVRTVFMRACDMVLRRERDQNYGVVELSRFGESARTIWTRVR